MQRLAAYRVTIIVEKTLVDLVLTLLAAGGPLLQLPTAHGRMTEQTKSKSAGCFLRPEWSPCMHNTTKARFKRLWTSYLNFIQDQGELVLRVRLRAVRRRLRAGHDGRRRRLQGVPVRVRLHAPTEGARSGN